MKHSHFGEVTSVGAHHSSPDHLELTIAHGKKKKAKKGGELSSYDDRPTSRMVMPKQHAAHYPVGKRVKIGMTPMGSAMPAAGGMDDGDEDDLDAFMKKRGGK